MEGPYREPSTPAAAAPLFFVCLAWYAEEEDEHRAEEWFVRAIDRLAALEAVLAAQNIHRSDVWSWRVVGRADFDAAEEKAR